MVRCSIPLLMVLGMGACAGDGGTDGAGGGLTLVEQEPLTFGGTEPSEPTPFGDDDDDDATGACGPTELCMRSIDECEVNLTQAECEAFYDTAEATGGCRDIDAYTACNCDCIGEATCDGYFACGQLCFLDHCEF